MNTPRFWAILGPAGTGKSTRVRDLCQDPRFGKQTSSTGIAALNIGGVTVNYFLGFFNFEDLLIKAMGEGRYRLLENLRSIATQYKYLIIDEISMLDGAVLDIIVGLVDELERSRNLQLGILVVGDPGQLPVVGKPSQVEFDNGIKRTFQPIPFFKAKCWKRFEIEKLTKIYRQDNPEFIESLIALRRGDLSGVKWFEENIQFEENFDYEFGGPTVMTKNLDVDDFNKKMLEKLESESHFYPVIRKGEQRPEWKLLPEKIELRTGAMAMVLENLPGMGVANGDVGQIILLNESGAMLRFNKPNREPFTLFFKPTELKNEDTRRGKLLGTIERLPLRLAFSSTVFKCQGLTFDRVQIKLRDSFMRRISGGMYTALSRVRRPEGLRLVGSPHDLRMCIFVDEQYKCLL